jgi:protein-S-isoprenylcysteine O-methyltransferase Ste14
MSSRSKTTVYLFLSWPPHAVAYIVAPLLLARWSNDHGWNRDLPFPLRLAGLAFVAVGVAIIGWAITSHYRASPDRVQRTLEPDYLVTNGAYARTRNPLYLGGTCMWLGWAIWFASPAIVAGAALLTIGFCAFAVPFEERRLARRFGPAFTEYTARVPRWPGQRVAG